MSKRYEDLLANLPPIGGGVNYDFLLNYFPIFLNLKDVQQDLLFHGEGDVWTHTKMVCDEIIKTNEYISGTEEERFVLFYSAFWHDIGKLFCTKSENGKITSKGHSKVGSREARIELWKMGVPFKLREDIVNIVANHQVPFFIFSENREAPEFLVDSLSWKLPLNLLLAVSRADIIGRICENKKDVIDNLELVEELARERGCLKSKKVFPDNFTRMRYFRGGGKIYSEMKMFAEKNFEVIVMCGLPASGKNTWISENLSHLDVVSFDDEKENLGLSEKDNVGRAVHLVIDKAKDFLRKEKSFVWNATNTNDKMRKKTLDLLYSYGATVKIVYLEPSFENLMDRNSKRDSSISNKKILNMLYVWDVPTEFEAESVFFDIGYKKKQKMILSK